MKLTYRDVLARERTLLAEERTLLSWIVTSIGGFALGAAIIRFFEDSVFRWMVYVGIIIIGLGILLLIHGLYFYLKHKKKIYHFKKQKREKYGEEI